MADQVNKGKQSNLYSFITQTPKSNNKRDQPASSPDIDSPSTKQVGKQARLASLDSTLNDSNNDSAEKVASSIQSDTVVQLSGIVCAILKNQDFIESIIPLISDKVLEMIRPKVTQIVDECMHAHVLSMQQNTRALSSHEAELLKHTEEINALKARLNKAELKLEEQEQYSRRTSLRFNNVKVPTDGRGNIIKPIDTDSLVLDICNNKLKVNIETKDIGRSHPIGEIRDGKVSIIVRFLSYRQRQIVFSSKKKLKGNPDKTYIAENLTKYRYDLLNRLNTLRISKKVHSFWTHDGSVIVKENESSRPKVVRSRYDIYSLGGEVLPNDDHDSY